LSFSYGRKRPTIDFEIAAVHTSSCNVLCPTHTHIGNSTEELQAPIAESGPGWPGQRQKAFPAISLCKLLSGVHLLEMACQIVNLKQIKTDSPEVGKIDGI
jgi:hypothetical protein